MTIKLLGLKIEICKAIAIITAQLQRNTEYVHGKCKWEGKGASEANGERESLKTRIQDVLQYLKQTLKKAPIQE